MSETYVDNPETGERIALVARNSNDGVEVAVFDFRLAPGGAVPVEHMHESQVERYEVQAGRIAFRIDGVERVLEAGEVVEIGAGQFHGLKNAGDGEARARA
jgi:quercetin dioxygenase-like cupin family protein